MMTRAEIIARTISRHGAEPTRRNVREYDCKDTDEQIDRALAVVLADDGWIVDPGKVTKAKTSVSYRNSAKLRDKRNTWIKSNDPAFWDKPKRGA